MGVQPPPIFTLPYGRKRTIHCSFEVHVKHYCSVLLDAVPLHHAPSARFLYGVTIHAPSVLSLTGNLSAQEHRPPMDNRKRRTGKCGRKWSRWKMCHQRVCPSRYYSHIGLLVLKACVVVFTIRRLSSRFCSSLITPVGFQPPRYCTEFGLKTNARCKPHNTTFISLDSVKVNSQYSILACDDDFKLKHMGLKWCQSSTKTTDAPVPKKCIMLCTAVEIDK